METPQLGKWVFSTSLEYQQGFAHICNGNTAAVSVFHLLRFVNVLLPPAARQEGVRVRWWQPQHEGADRSDWALDNVLIAGSDPRAQISDTFGGVALPNHERAPADETSGRVSLLNEQEETPIGDSTTTACHWETQAFL